MKVKKLKIKNFRHIENQEIIFGNKITVITGQNSTGKSSLLGWIAQAFDYKGKEKTLTNSLFKSRYSEIFRFCKDNDFSNIYEVSLVYNELEDDSVDKEKIMKTRYLPKTNKGPERYRVDFDGRGKALDFPVIYLGLKRLIPLATEKDISLNSIKLSNIEINTFSKLSKEILILLDSTIKSEYISSTNKDILAMKTDKYGHLGNSAGQDNIGQIISSLLSFNRLKNKEDFRGGILLIDEIDATLYAGSQIKLIDNLFKFARNNNVQVVFTTHSIEILEYLSEKVGEDTQINFLELKDGTIKNNLNPDIKQLKNKIKVQIGKGEKIIKKQVLCEDKETELWCRNLLNGTLFKNELDIMEGPFPHGTLTTMADSKHKIFREMFFVLDGDCRKNYQNSSLPSRTIILPGDYRPESIFYDYLYNLSDDDEFWDEENNFTKQTCFVNYQTESHDKGVIKRWFVDPAFKDFFGKNYSKLFNRWKKDNKTLVKEFQENFKNLFGK